jgi:hypothetical protein
MKMKQWGKQDSKNHNDWRRDKDESFQSQQRRKQELERQVIHPRQYDLEWRYCSTVWH